MKAFYFKIDTVGFSSMDSRLNEFLKQTKTRGFEKLSLSLLKSWASGATFENDRIQKEVLKYFRTNALNVKLEAVFEQQIIISMNTGYRDLTVNLHTQEYEKK